MSRRPVVEWPQVRCPTCGALAGNPCLTGGGNVASKPHRPRTAERVDAPPRKKALVPTSVRLAVRRRSGGWCELVDDNGVRCREYATQQHHLRRRSQGGLDTKENLLDLCAVHHGWVHSHPQAAADAGYLVLRPELGT